MSFCLFCGAALNAAAESKRASDAMLAISCVNCGKSDPLSKKFCVFCGSEIYIPGAAAPDSSAFRKFSWELQRLEGVEEVVAQPVSQGPVAHRKSALGWTLPLAFIGILAGCSTAVVLNNNQILQRAFLHLTWPRDALVLFTEPGRVNFVLEDQERHTLLLGQTAANGSMVLSDLPAPQTYSLRMSRTGYKSKIQSVPVKDFRTTVLGYPVRFRLPEMAKSKSAGAEASKKSKNGQ